MKHQHLTRGLVSGGALSRGTLRRNLGVRLPSEPLRNPARTPSLKTVRRQRATVQRIKTQNNDKLNLRAYEHFI